MNLLKSAVQIKKKKMFKYFRIVYSVELQNSVVTFSVTFGGYFFYFYPFRRGNKSILSVIQTEVMRVISEIIRF